ncbi:hypothetical protein B0T10DRAFT_43675 [Thelonectria olida]|uniref:Uncharacterized protein n=1 Tax=Thelonectria olida TaxID=1576542 RepID=A0A9P8W530_9HYPO|nr:hypothetical protein B0T10DRAFT_43675 [Thelonectria olida]
MANCTPEVNKADPSLFGFHPLDEKLMDLRSEAISEIVIVQPPEKEPGIHTYGFPKACTKMHEVLETQTSQIKLTNACIGRRVREPEAFRLLKGHDARITGDFIALAVLLSNSRANIRFRFDGMHSSYTKWQPEQALYFSGAALISEDRQINFCLAVYELELNRKL